MAQKLQISDFEYDLPEELIAQEPCARREDARLLVVDRSSQSISHHHIYDLPRLLKPGDLLVFNNSKVLSARIFGLRSSTGGKWEGLYLRDRPDLGLACWELMAHSRGYIQPGEWIDLLDRSQNRTSSRLQVIGRTSDNHLLVTVDPSISAIDLCDQIGHVPLPPYIRKGVDSEQDRDRYQTVFANDIGSVAAPTAGLHFPPELLTNLTQHEVQQAYVTLHVGIGTFAPVKVSNLNDHVMHEEWCRLPASTSEAINTRKGRCIAVGTTTARTLEAAAFSSLSKETDSQHILTPWTGTTNLFIRPGFRFRIIDSLLTNFHLPRSTLLVLVSAFAGHDLIMKAYTIAIQERYRFFSYGDAMLIL